jgi:hypothetical protein
MEESDAFAALISIVGFGAAHQQPPRPTPRLVRRPGLDRVAAIDNLSGALRSAALSWEGCANLRMLIVAQFHRG